jgi:hypothetical protein
MEDTATVLKAMRVFNDLDKAQRYLEHMTSRGLHHDIRSVEVVPLDQGTSWVIKVTPKRGGAWYAS